MGKKKVLVYGLLVLAFSMIIFADSYAKSIDVVYRNIQLVVDNQKVQLGTDSAGQAIEPFIYNGTTYLPVRAVGEALGKEVSWDGETNTVYIGKRNEVETISRLNDDVAHMAVDGILAWNIKGGQLVSDIASNEYSYWLESNWTGKYIDYPLNGEYKIFKAKLGWGSRSKTNSNDIIVKIFADDKEVASYDLKHGEFTREISADVSGALRMRIKYENVNVNSDQSIMLFDPILVK